MPNNNNIRDFLNRPDNLEVALTAIRALTPLKVQLHRLFWSEFMKYMNDRLIGSDNDYSVNWTLQLSPVDQQEKGYANFDILPVIDGHLEEKQVIFVRLEQRDHSSNYEFRYGVMAPELSESDKSLEAIAKLRTVLTDNGFRRDGRSPWWLGLRGLKPSARDDVFLLSMAGDRQAFVRQLADNIWNLFAENEALLRDANRNLAGASN